MDADWDKACSGRSRILIYALACEVGATRSGGVAGQVLEKAGYFRIDKGRGHRIVEETLIVMIEWLRSESLNIVTVTVQA